MFSVARYTANGSLDPTFGSGGTVATNPGGSAAATGVVVQSDGKIIAVGAISASGVLANGVMVRFNTNGQLDPTFGSGGKAFSVVSPTGVVLQPDGKIVLAGIYAVLRYNSDGSLDAGFKASGLFPFPTVLQLQGDSKIVLAAANTLARVNSDGTFDAGFGDTGKVMASVTIVGVALAPDGKIVVTGRSSDPGFAVARYNTDGSLDAGFGAGGKATVVIGSSDAPAAVAVQADGKIVTVGSTSDGEHTNYALARFNPDGSLDSSFASAGKLTTSFSGTVDTAATAVAVQPDGKVVVAGVFQDDFTLTRYTANGNLDGAFANGGKIAIDKQSASTAG